jgi:hypothetical protein
MVLDPFDDDNDDDRDDVDNDDYDDDMTAIDASIPIKMTKDTDNMILLMMIVD